MDFSSDQTNSTATPGVPPGKRPQIRWLTIVILVMVGVTVITGLIAVYDLLSYLLIVVGDVDLSLAMVREQEEGRSLFWPVLLVTAILWLWKSLAETSRARLPALVLTGLALYGVVTWTIMDGTDTREPFVVRTWICPSATAAWDLTARDPACAEFPANDVNWFMIDESLSRPVPATGFQEPSSRRENISIWEGLPRGRYVVYLANDASVERYESIALISLRDDEATGFPGFMHVSELTDGRWVSRVEIETWLQGIDVYLIPAATPAPSGGPTSPEIDERHSLPQTDPKRTGHRNPRREPGIRI